MFTLLTSQRRRDPCTKLLLHCNGNDEATAMKDYSSNDHQVTFNGNTQLDVAQKKFGVSSGLFDGTGDYLSVPDSDDWYMAIGNFTIDFWVRFADISANKGLFLQRVDNDDYVFCAWDQSVPELQFWIQDGGINTVALRCGWSPSADVWYHISVVRGWGGNANDWAACIDGTQIGSTLTDSDPWPDLAAEFWIGRTMLTYTNGWIDEFRVSKGIARWTETFTPPAAPYR